jgi:hypothetical protein
VAQTFNGGIDIDIAEHPDRSFSAIAGSGHDRPQGLIECNDRAFVQTSSRTHQDSPQPLVRG